MHTLPRTDDHSAILEELLRCAHEDPTLVQFRSAVTAHQYLPAYGLVTRHLRRPARVLDWGSGNGHFSYFLVRRGHHVSSFDFSDVPAACRALAPDRYAHTRASLEDPVHLPFETGSFDAVVSAGVLEHVRETGGTEAASLSEIRRVLKPGGLFLCFHFPNRLSWIDATARAVGRKYHVFRYTPAEVAALISSAELELLELQRYAMLPRNIWSSDAGTHLARSRRVARAYDRLDRFLGVLLSPFAQNLLFVAKKPA